MRLLPKLPVTIVFIEKVGKICYTSYMKSSSSLPENLSSILWSYDLGKLDLKNDRRAILINIINYGNWNQWRWLVKTYSPTVVREEIKEIPATAFRPGALKLISLLLKVSIPQHARKRSQ